MLQAYAFIFCLLRQVHNCKTRHMIFNVGLACHRAPLYIVYLALKIELSVATQQTTYLSHVCLYVMIEETFCWFFKLKLWTKRISHNTLIACYAQ